MGFGRWALAPIRTLAPGEGAMKRPWPPHFEGGLTPSGGAGFAEGGARSNGLGRSRILRVIRGPRSGARNDEEGVGTVETIEETLDVRRPLPHCAHAAGGLRGACADGAAAIANRGRNGPIAI